MTYDVALLLKAVRFSAGKHRSQRRKGADALPYINHPIEVAELLANVGGVSDLRILAAAVLHDTVEDTNTSLEEIQERFGHEVRAIVQELTDDKSLPKDDRKRLQAEHAAGLSKAAKPIKIADKICNVRDVIDNPPSGWSPQRRREYLQWAEKVVAGCRGCNPALEQRFDEVLQHGWSVLDA